MALLHQIAARNPESGLWNVVIDTPKGSRNKYKYDEAEGLWRLSKGNRTEGVREIVAAAV